MFNNFCYVTITKPVSKNCCPLKVILIYQEIHLTGLTNFCFVQNRCWKKRMVIIHRIINHLLSAFVLDLYLMSVIYLWFQLNIYLNFFWYRRWWSCVWHVCLNISRLLLSFHYFFFKLKLLLSILQAVMLRGKCMLFTLNNTGLTSPKSYIVFD